MARKYFVPVRGAASKQVQVESGATRGARLGVDLLGADGTLLTLERLAAVLAPLVQPEPPAASRAPPTLWSRVQEKPPNILEAAALATDGLIVRLADGSWVTREIAVQPRLTIVDGDGAGDPTLDLATLADNDQGVLVAIERDAWGRVAGTRVVVQGDIPDLAMSQITGLVAALAGKSPTIPDQMLATMALDDELLFYDVSLGEYRKTRLRDLPFEVDAISVALAMIAVRTPAATVSFGTPIVVNADLAAIAVEALAALVGLGQEIAAGVAETAVATLPATIGAGHAIDALAAQIAVATNPAVISLGHELDAELASVAVDTNPAVISLAQDVPAQAAEIAVTTNPAVVAVAHEIAAGVATIAVDAPPATVALPVVAMDDFSVDTIGTDWANGPGVSENMEITGGVLRPTATVVAEFAAVRRTAETYDGDHYSEIEVAAQSANGALGCSVRMQGNATAECYSFVNVGGNLAGEFRLIAIADDGTETQLDVNSGDWAAADDGDVMRLEVVGNQLSGIVNRGAGDELVVSATDGTYSGGAPGIAAAAIANAATDAVIESWAGGDIVT